LLVTSQCWLLQLHPAAAAAAAAAAAGCDQKGALHAAAALSAAPMQLCYTVRQLLQIHRLTAALHPAAAAAAAAASCLALDARCC
jgi:hypothetical protein